MNKEKVILAILYVGAAVTVSGCVLAAVGAGAAGTVAYVKGDLEVLEDKDLDTVYAASKKALEDLELAATKTKSEQLSFRAIRRIRR